MTVAQTELPAAAAEAKAEKKDEPAKPAESKDAVKAAEAPTKTEAPKLAEPADPQPTVAMVQVPEPAGEGSTDAINSFSSEKAFKAAWRMGNALATSSIGPKDYRGNVPNCMIAIELASRTGSSVFCSICCHVQEVFAK